MPELKVPNEATPIVDPAVPRSDVGNEKLAEKQRLEQSDDWSTKPLSANYWPSVYASILVLWPVLMGNVLEFYEFGAYGFVVDEITDNFFSASWLTWLFFAVSFIMRPVGGLLFGVLGDRIGRKEATWWSIFGMSMATVLQGCLPSRHWGGHTVGENVGVCLLFCCRVVQGLCTGGEIGGVITYLAESGSKESLAATISFISLTCQLAFATSSGLVTALHLLFGDENMEVWAWRVPFWLAFVPACVCLYRLKYLPESQAFQLAQLEVTSLEKGTMEKGVVVPRAPTVHEYLSDTKLLCQAYQREITIVFFSVAAIAALWYVGPVYSVTYVDHHGGSALAARSAASLAQMLTSLLALPVAWVTDQWGVNKMCLVGNFAILVVSIPMMAALAAYAESLVVIWTVMGLGFGLLQALTGSVIFLLVAELFPTPVRNAAAGLSYNLSVAVFGGCGPLYCSSMTDAWDSFPGYYLAGVGALSTASVAYVRWLRRQGLMRVTHLRSDPY